MGTRYTARFHAPQETDVKSVAAALGAAVTAVDDHMSNWKPDSALSRVNRAAPGVWTAVPANLVAVLKRAAEIGSETQNAFNVGVGDLVDAWGFGPKGTQYMRNAVVEAGPRPSIDALLEIDVAGLRVRKHGAIVLDLCGIAKGFGVDELARVLDEQGIDSWLVGVDGEMRARGAKPDGSPWVIALESPHEAHRAAMSVIELSDASIATSGDYRHYASIDGQRVSHTMDPRTGAPLCNSLASATVISRSCMEADAYATAMMVLGEEAGCQYAQHHGIDVCLVMREGDALRVAGTGIFADA